MSNFCMGGVLFQVNVRANVGSTSRIAEQIGQVAILAGWESYIAYGRSANPSKSKLIRVGSKLDVMWHSVLSRLFDCHGLASNVATKRLVKQIRQIKPDIIHLHNIHGYYLNYKILFDYLNGANIPVVWTLHDCWAFTGHCAHFVSVDCMRWRDGGCEKCPLKNRYPKSYTDFSARNFRLKKRLFTSNLNLHIVTPSEWLQQYVNQSFLKNCDVVTIYNGIDLQVFNKEALAPSTIKKTGEERVVLGVSSVWTARKGLEDFKQLRQRLPLDVKIVLVGLKPEQIQDLPEGIIGVERTQNVAELAGYYELADVFVNPTYADTFPTVNLESLACGTPVITYKTGGSPEAVTPETGVVVEQGDLAALCDAIENVLKNGKDFYRNACRKRAEECFDKNKCFQQYIELYNKILNNK